MIKIDPFTQKGIAHGFFGRAGGVSHGLYQSLNCGLGSGDARENVLENRALVARALGAPTDRLLTVWQVHSAEALIVTEAFPEDDQRPKLDALVTRTKGLVLGSLTADCGPVLFADPKAEVIGAAHAGWKGALAGITDATITKMEELGAKRSDIIAAIGPTISQASYEVGPEFRENFIRVLASNVDFFQHAPRADHFLFDLPAYLVRRLNEAGVGTVVNTGICTYAHEQDYFSYRRATHRAEPDYGRQVAAIMIEG